MAHVVPAEQGEERLRNAIFAAPADDPRARRPVDVAVLVVALLGVGAFGWMYRRSIGLDTRVVELFGDGVPGWMSGIATIVYMAGGLYVAVLIIGVLVFERGRLALVRDMLLAAVLAIGAVIVASYAVGREFPDLVPELRERSGYPSFPVMRLSAALAVIGVAGPFLSAPMRTLGRRLVAGMALSAVVLAFGTVTAVVGGVFVGIAAAAGVHIAFGSGQGIPSAARIRSALAEAGIEVTDVTYPPYQPAGATLVSATRADGTRLAVKVYGRDARDAALVARLWRAIWYVDERRSLSTSRMQLAEHEALLLLALERAGIPAPRVVTGTRSSIDDVVLVLEWIDGVHRVDPATPPDDETLDEVWCLLDRLHAVGIAHGGIDPDSVVIGHDGPRFANVGSAEFATGGAAIAADRAQLLATTALWAGTDRALDVAVRHLDHDDVIEVLPVLQTAVLPRVLQIELRAHDVSVDDVREGLADRVGAAAPELAKLRRVSWGSVLMAALTLVAAYTLISSLTDIGIDTIVEQYTDVIWAWVVVAFTAAQFTNIGEVITLRGVIGRPVPFGPTLMYRYALSFISLAVPSEAGSIAMSIRYQQKLGVPAAAAVAQGPLLTIFSKGFDVILLLLTAQFVGRTIDAGEIDFGPIVRLVILIVIVAIVAIIVVFTVPRLRERAVPHLSEGWASVRDSVTDPGRLGTIVAGTLFQKVLFAIVLGASVAAFGGSVPFASAIFVNTAVSLFVGLVPVPGGIGVAESALTAGLIAVGVPAEVALAAAITHRMCTSYIPPVFGWWASRWLTGHGYL